MTQNGLTHDQYQLLYGKPPLRAQPNLKQPFVIAPLLIAAIVAIAGIGLHSQRTDSAVDTAAPAVAAPTADLGSDGAGSFAGDLNDGQGDDRFETAPPADEVGSAAGADNDAADARATVGSIPAESTSDVAAESDVGTGDTSSSDTNDQSDQPGPTETTDVAPSTDSSAEERDAQSPQQTDDVQEPETGNDTAGVGEPSVDVLGTIEEPPTTERTPQLAPAQVCTNEGLGPDQTFRTLPGVTCEDVLALAEEVLGSFGFESESIGVFIEVQTVCVTSGQPFFYLTQSEHVPVLADTIVGAFCEGDRDLVIPIEG